MSLLYEEETYKPDFICFDKIIVELKSIAKINDQHKGQTINYLKATGMKLGIIVNFGSWPKAEICRLAL